MELSFLVVAAKPRRRISDHQLRLMASSQPPGLHFVPGSHLFRRNDECTFAIGIWQEPLNASDSRWSTDPTTTTWSTGHLRRRGRPWPPEGGWASELVAATQDVRLPELAEELAGVFTAGHAHEEGTCTLVSDPLGYRLIYYGESADVGAASSRAVLVAQALAQDGKPPERDPISAGWLAYAGYRLGDHSGFLGVRVAPPSSVVRAKAEDGISLEARSAAWLPTASEQSLDTDELIERARSSIAESLRAVLTLPCDRRVFGLTGGKDSRLILAVLWSEGLADDCEFVTIGPPDLADVRVAAQLASRLGLRHTNDFPVVGHNRSYGKRVRAFVESTAGMLNIWDLKERANGQQIQVRVSGLCGEILRTYRPIRTGLDSQSDLARMYAPGRTFGRLGLIRSEVADEFHSLTLDALLDDPGRDSSPIDLLDAFHLKYRVRFSRLGPLEELNDELRVLPLYSIDAIRAAFALGGEARHAELLHFEIIRRCCPPLIDEPFAGPGWAEELASDGAAPNGPIAGDQSSAAQTSAGSKAEPLMARLQAAGFDDRRHALEEVFRDRANPAWDVIDPEKALQALGRFGQLRVSERRELYGAATAGLWLSPAT